jgi:hypothetical protein
MNCEYCFKEFKTISSLNYHKKTSKKCIINRPIVDDIKIDIFECNFCNKEFPQKKNLLRHLEICKKKEIKEILEEVKQPQNDLHELISVKEELRKLKEDYERLKENEKELSYKLQLKDEQLKMKDEIINILQNKTGKTSNTTNNTTSNTTNNVTYNLTLFSQMTPINQANEKLKNDPKICRDIRLHGLVDGMVRWLVENNVIYVTDIQRGRGCASYKVTENTCKIRRGDIGQMAAEHIKYTPDMERVLLEKKSEVQDKIIFAPNDDPSIPELLIKSANAHNDLEMFNDYKKTCDEGVPKKTKLFDEIGKDASKFKKIDSKDLPKEEIQIDEQIYKEDDVMMIEVA